MQCSKWQGEYLQYFHKKISEKIADIIHIFFWLNQNAELNQKMMCM